MAESVPVNNDMLEVIATPPLQHFVDNSPESSPTTTPTPAPPHADATPAVGAQGGQS